MTGDVGFVTALSRRSYQKRHCPKNRHKLGLNRTLQVGSSAQHPALDLKTGARKELEAEDFEFLKGKTKVSLIYGTEDQFMDDERLAYEAHRALDLFDNDVNIIPFDGNHKVNVELVNKLV